MQRGASIGLAATIALWTPPIRAADPSAPQGPERFDDSRFEWSRCAHDGDDDAPCIRPRPARVLLLSLGALAGGVAAGVLFALGDRLAPGDPATVLVGTGALAGAGALVGMAAGRLRGDDPMRSDRVRPATGDLVYGFSPPTLLDERPGHTAALRFAPTWRFADGSRVRVIGHLGGNLAPTKHVDPRPQSTMTIDGQDGNAPVALRQRETSFGIGLDWAVNLPYPVLAPHRSSYLGPAEIRWKPDVQIRREIQDDGRPTERVVSRTMLLPLTVGMRWHLSPRQRFTFYLGPRLDFVSASAPGGTTLERGSAQLGPLYGEAWYDLDVPFTEGPRRDGKPRRTETNGQLTLGYVHSRFDGNGFNFGPVVGFLGPIVAQWHTRVRPRGAPVAFQATAGVAVGQGTTFTVAAGVVAPDLSRRNLRRRRAKPERTTP